MNQKIINYFFDEEEWEVYETYIKFLGKISIISFSICLLLQVIV